VGNRARGERLSALVDLDRQKLAAAVVLLSPFVPLLFMGEEYGERRPFLYFTSHGDLGLVEAVREGRRAEFAGFEWQGEVPDPQDPATFAGSTLQHELAQHGEHAVLRELYGELLRLRRDVPALASLDKDAVETAVLAPASVLFVRRGTGPCVGRHGLDRSTEVQSDVSIVFSLAQEPCSVAVPFRPGRWVKRLDTADGRWLGPGSELPAIVEATGPVCLKLSPWSAAVFSFAPDDSLVVAG
jgi:maltooligosyltrehalose trehalohydrolase